MTLHISFLLLHISKKFLLILFVKVFIVYELFSITICIEINIYIIQKKTCNKKRKYI